MESLMLLAPLIGLGVGTAAGYGVSRRNRRIHFVEGKDLPGELDEFDIDIDEVETCAVCGEEVNPENIGALVRENGDYRVVCDDPVCLDTYDL